MPGSGQCVDGFRGEAVQPQEGRVQRADRGADHHIGADIGLEQCPQRADLQRAARSAATQHETNFVFGHSNPGM